MAMFRAGQQTHPLVLAHPARRPPPPSATVAQSILWVLWRALDQRLPIHVGSGGRTEWNRTRNRLPESHNLDALAVDQVETINRVLVAGCAGRGSRSRTRPDRYGFPRLRSPRTQRFFGFSTGDLVRSVVPKGGRTGVHTGRGSVRASGDSDITTTHGTVQGIGHKHVRPLRRAGGYGYTWKGEGVSSRP